MLDRFMNDSDEANGIAAIIIAKRIFTVQDMVMMRISFSSFRQYVNGYLWRDNKLTPPSINDLVTNYAT